MDRCTESYLQIQDLEIKDANVFSKIQKAFHSARIIFYFVKLYFLPTIQTDIEWTRAE